MDWVESLSERRSLFALCIAHCLQFEHSGDSTILQCVTVHRVPKFTSCHNAIMVVTGRAHCSILLYMYKSPLRPFLHRALHIYIYMKSSVQKWPK